MLACTFRSYFAGGFECSSHKRRDGVRLDVIASTGHDRYAAADYRLLQSHGMAVARDGLRWHLIGRERGRYDWSSFAPMLEAARETGMQVVWDLLHYGWPEWTDPFDPDFPEHFADFAGAAAALIGHGTNERTFYLPVNEISFLAWGGGSVGCLNPFRRDEGPALKIILVRAALRAIEAIRAVDPGAVISVAEPLIRVHPNADTLDKRREADRQSALQWEAMDMLLGRSRPDLVGREDAVDLIGVNYYPDNQWLANGPKISRDHPRYNPLSELLIECWERYRRPLWISETGCEGDARVPWFRYVADQAEQARAAGVPIEALCLYPILNHLGWDDNRYCPNGLFLRGRAERSPPRVRAARGRVGGSARPAHRSGVAASSRPLCRLLHQPSSLRLIVATPALVFSPGTGSMCPASSSSL
jgi:beta-glucosidase/6-phospho-beta-glucosidase/beta-galactosidase